MAALIFPDNTVLINFASVHRLDLLRAWLRDRGRWTEAMAYEAQRSASHWPDLRPVCYPSRCLTMAASVSVTMGRA